MNRPRPSRAQPAGLGAASSRYDQAPRWRRREEIGDAPICFVVYRLPRDFNGYVVRAFGVEVEGLTPLEYVIAGTLENCRAAIPPEANKRLSRAFDDVPAIFETWS